MIGAGLPECVVARHAVVANKRVHDGFLEAVSHMKAASHVGWRDHNAIGLFATLGGEIPLIFPLLIPASFNVGGLECFIHNLVNPKEDGSLSRPKSLASVASNYTVVVR